MKEEDDVVVREAGVTLGHLLADEQLDAGVDSIDPVVPLRDRDVLGQDRRCHRRAREETGDEG